jgi:outer membrane biosynthesis protein TonB
MQAATNRTFICSVVFLDIVEYSKKPVAEQIHIKERLNGLLTEALANVAPNDRIILDTGDGAALSFLGDPEDALFVSLALRDGFSTPQLQGPDMKMRIGINLGPVKLVKDINGQPNIIGDGINVAQRVMSFAEPGQILVSRSYYEVASCLSEGYVQLFHYEGSRTDKHVREHEVYAIEASPGAAVELAAAAAPRNAPAVEDTPVVSDKLSQSASFVADNLRRKPQFGTALAVMAILAIAVGIRAYRQPPAPAPTAQPKTPPPKVATAAPAKVAPAPARVTEAPKAEGKSDPSKRASKPIDQSPPAAIAKKAPESAAKAGSKGSAASGSGSILVTVRPWGEIYVDGQSRGEAPPLYEVRLSAGRHRVEIRHPDFPPHVRTVDVANGTRVEVRHVFLPKDRSIRKPPWN